jgi:hypothetical protein
MRPPTEDKLIALERERQRQRTINAYHRIFLGEDGQTVLDDLKRSFGTESQVFLPGHDFNPIPAALRDGQRGVVLHIEAMLRRSAGADGDLEEPKHKVLK